LAVLSEVGGVILLLEGVPGSGKSYWGFANRVLPALKAGRRMYVHLDGALVDKWALFLGEAEPDLAGRVTVWVTEEEVRKGILEVEPNSFVFVDEVQSIWRAGDKVDRRTLRWFETHRHLGVDVVMACQAYAQVCPGLTRLVESCISFQKLWAVGLEGHAMAFVRGMVGSDAVIRRERFKYNPEIFPWYKSYVATDVGETKRGWGMLGSLTVLGPVAVAAVAVVLVFGHTWVFDVDSQAAEKVSSSKKAVREVSSENPASTEKVCVEGQISASPGRGQLYLLSTGEWVSLEELTARSGGKIRERSVIGGLKEISGEGILYGHRCH